MDSGLEGELRMFGKMATFPYGVPNRHRTSRRYRSAGSRRIVPTATLNGFDEFIDS